MLWFVNHEWRKHGTCGKETPDSYFEQICALSAPIVAKVNELRAAGMDDYTYLDDIACQVDFMSDDIELFSHGRNTDGPEGRSNGEFMVSACLDPSGTWHLARSHHASRRRARGGSVTSASFPFCRPPSPSSRRCAAIRPSTGPNLSRCEWVRVTLSTGGGRWRFRSVGVRVSLSCLLMVCLLMVALGPSLGLSLSNFFRGVRPILLSASSPCLAQPRQQQVLQGAPCDRLPRRCPCALRALPIFQGAHSVTHSSRIRWRVVAAAHALQSQQVRHSSIVRLCRLHRRLRRLRRRLRRR